MTTEQASKPKRRLTLSGKLYIWLTIIGMVREILGSGAIFGMPLVEGDGLMPLVFILAPGGFLVLGYLMVMFNKIAKR